MAGSRTGLWLGRGGGARCPVQRRFKFWFFSTFAFCPQRAPAQPPTPLAHTGPLSAWVELPEQSGKRAKVGRPAQASVRQGACRCPERTACGDRGAATGKGRHRLGPGQGQATQRPLSHLIHPTEMQTLRRGPPSVPLLSLLVPCLKQALAQRLSKLIHWPPNGRARGGVGLGERRSGVLDLSPHSHRPLPVLPVGLLAWKQHQLAQCQARCPAHSRQSVSVQWAERSRSRGWACPCWKEHRHTEPRGPGPRGQEAGPGSTRVDHVNSSHYVA